MILPLLYGGIVGLSLGLTGGGGSIFAVPLLVYGLEAGMRRAVALSLAVVGLTSLYGALLQARSGLVVWGAGLVLGVGGIIGAPFGARLGALLPEQLALLLFAGLMLLIGWRILQPTEGALEVPLPWVSCARSAEGKPHFNLACAAKLLAFGALTGVLSGIFGVGGGFLVVPALMVVTGIGIEQALATSLVGIFLIAGSGFAANANQLAAGDAELGLLFLLGSGAGMTLGAALKTSIPAVWLKRIFGLTVLGVAAYVIVKNLKNLK
jgi:uncharacterized protein